MGGLPAVGRDRIYIYIYKMTVYIYLIISCLPCTTSPRPRFASGSRPRAAVFEPPRTRRRVLRFSCCVACPGLSDKASRPPSLAEWTADGNARAPAHFCACPFFRFPLRARPAHRIRHSGRVPAQAELFDQQGPGPNIITYNYFQNLPNISLLYTHCFVFFFFLLPRNATGRPTRRTATPLPLRRAVLRAPCSR